MNGIIVVDKPQAHTSFDVIAIMRKITGQRKIGHTGTLDPMATGVLPLLLGKATRAQSLVPDTDKEYIAEFKLGIKTDTQDITGKVISEVKPSISKVELDNVLDRFRGNIMQLPPMYSAVQKNGQRLYELARKGIEIDRESRPITIHTLELKSFDIENQIGSILVKCSKGTYIRTLCQDIGDVLGCGATLTSLRRTMACNFTLDDAITIEKIKGICDSGNLDSLIIPIDKAFMQYNYIRITDNQSIRFKNGGGLMLSRLKFSDSVIDGDIFRVYSNDMSFLGLGKVSIEKEELSVLKLFC